MTAQIGFEGRRFWVRGLGFSAVFEGLENCVLEILAEVVPVGFWDVYVYQVLWPVQCYVALFPPCFNYASQ